jgi:CYTH domain-containing protein
MKKPEFRSHSVERKRVYILQELPAGMSRTDEHWQIFDDYTAWPDHRLRQVRIPETKQWYRVKESREALNIENGVTEEFSRELIIDDSPGTAMHPELEIRKNRYFYQYEGGEAAIDIFLGALTGLVMAQVNFENDEEMVEFSLPDFAAGEVSRSEFFLGENLVKASFEEVKKQLTLNGN